MYRPALHDLDAVLAVARRASFRAAALELGMSTTALSSAVAKLEEHLGVRLFNRTTRSVSLTDAGRAFVEHVGPGLEDIHGAMAGARSQQATPSGMLRINTFATAARQILSPLVLEFVRRYPRVHVDIVAEGFDLGVRTAERVPNDMIAVPLGKPQRHAVVGSPAYFAKHGRPRTPTDLLEHQCIRVRLPNGGIFRWVFRRRGQEAQVDVQGPMTLDEASLARTAVREGIGLGFFMEPDVRADIEAGHLIRVLDDWTPQLGKLALYYPGRRNQSAALKAFVSLARERNAPVPR